MQKKLQQKLKIKEGRITTTQRQTLRRDSSPNRNTNTPIIHWSKDLANQTVLMNCQDGDWKQPKTTTETQKTHNCDPKTTTSSPASIFPIEFLWSRGLWDEKTVKTWKQRPIPVLMPTTTTRPLLAQASARDQPLSDTCLCAMVESRQSINTALLPIDTYQSWCRACDAHTACYIPCEICLQRWKVDQIEDATTFYSSFFKVLLVKEFKKHWNLIAGDEVKDRNLKSSSRRKILSNPEIPL